MLKPFEHKDWDDRRYEHDIPGYLDDLDPKHYVASDKRREMDPSETQYKEQRRYEDADNLNMLPKIKTEVGHNAHVM